jgi:cytochrome c-type biogenesis protein
VAFSLGLGLPFLLAGAFMDRAQDALRRLRRHLPAIKVASGILLVGMGLLIAFGRLQQLSARLLGWGARLTVWDAAHPLLSDVVFSAAVLVAFAGPPAADVLRRAAADARRKTSGTEGSAGARTRPLRSVLAIASAAAGIVLAVLNLTGTISIAGWVAGWFRFTGL